MPTRDAKFRFKNNTRFYSFIASIGTYASFANFALKYPDNQKSQFKKSRPFLASNVWFTRHPFVCRTIKIDPVPMVNLHTNGGREKPDGLSPCLKQTTKIELSSLLP